MKCFKVLSSVKVDLLAYRKQYKGYIPYILMKHKGERVKIRCECGALVGGTTKLHAKANVTLHKRSKKHKELMEIKTSREGKQ